MMMALTCCCPYSISLNYFSPLYSSSSFSSNAVNADENMGRSCASAPSVTVNLDLCLKSRALCRNSCNTNILAQALSSRNKPKWIHCQLMQNDLNASSPFVVSSLNFISFPKLASFSSYSTKKLSSCSALYTLSSGITTLRCSIWPKCAREGEEFWVWRRRKRRILQCAIEETPKSIMQESGNKRRAARTADSVIQRVEQAKEAMERRALARGSTRLYPRSLLESLNERIRQNQWESALRVFELVRAQEWYTAELSTYIKLLTLLAKCKQPEEASGLFDSMLKDKLRPTTAVFTALLTVYTKSNRFKKALELFESMRLFEGCLPDKYTYTAMIKGCCNAGFYDQASKIFNEMMWEGVEPTIVTYNTLIFGYGKAGMFNEIEQVLTLMESRNVAPDTVTWNTLIRVFGLHNRIAEMEQAYEGLLGQGLLPDSVTLNSLISAYGTMELYGKMQCVLDYMRRYCYSMTTVTYNIVIEIYGKAGKIDQMDMAFKSMKAEGVKPNNVTFSAILSAYGKHGIWHNVDKIMRQVDSYNAADTAVYNSAIDAYQRAQNYAEMEKLFEEMKEQGFVPDDITYAIMIAAYIRVRNFTKVQQLEEERRASKSK